MSEKSTGRPILGANRIVGAEASEPASTSKLSANAPEFVPRFQPSSHPQVSSVGPVTQLQGSIRVLTENPGSLDIILPSLTESLSQSIQNEEELSAVIEELFSQAVNETNFRYTGAKMCNYFSHNLQTSIPNSRPFRQQLLKRCQAEHEKRASMVKDSSLRDTLIGYTLFMGELLLNMKTEDGLRIKVIASAITELVTTMLDNIDYDQNLKCIIQVLKLTGAIVEDLTSKPDFSPLDPIFLKIKDLAVDSDLTRNQKAMLLSVIELRASHWGRKKQERQDQQINGSADGDASSSMGNQPGSDMPVFYDESGNAVFYGDANYATYYGGAEEWSGADEEFLEYMYSETGEYDGNQDAYDYGSGDYIAPEDNEMDDEIAAAFDQFMAEQNN